MQAIGRGPVLARYDLAMLRGNFAPGSDAVVIVFDVGVDIQSPATAICPHGNADQMALVLPPPFSDLFRIGRCLLETAGSWNWIAVCILVACRDRRFADDIERKNRNFVLGVCQCSIDHSAGLGVDLDCSSNRRTE